MDSLFTHCCQLSTRPPCTMQHLTEGWPTMLSPSHGPGSPLTCLAGVLVMFPEGLGGMPELRPQVCEAQVGLVLQVVG